MNAPENAADRYGIAALVQGTPVATFVIDTEHRVTHWNRACELVTGLSAAGMIGSSDHWRGFYPAPRPILADYIVAGEIEQAMACYEAGHCRASAIVSGAYEAEGFFPALGDGGCWLYFTAAPLHAADGRLIGAIETLQNITGRKRAELRLQAHSDELAQQVAQRTEELQQRNTELVELLRERCELEERVGTASNVAFSAMSSMGDMGVLLQAMQGFNESATAERLAEVVLDALAKYGLEGAVQLRPAGQSARILPDGHPLAEATFRHLAEMGRIVNFHRRMVVNFPQISLLLTNLPPADDERCGRIRDNVALLAEAAEARLQALHNESGRQAGASLIAGTLDEIRGLLDQLDRRQQSSLTGARLAIHAMEESLEKLFVHLGLTEQQESALIATVRDGLDALLEAQSGQGDFHAVLSGITRRLGSFA
ncbi:PAS domain-containing protein [Azonexus sp.]|uniref:PAS domain-containing protein n=1 Tax=Azonexus sp. TaxID=1872668 RepID=UPI0035AFFA42